MENPQKRKRLWIRLAAWGAVVAFVAVVAVMISVFLNGDRIKQMVVDEINHYLLAPAEVGSIEFSMVRDFPDVSVVFRNVAINAPQGLEGAPGLLHAESISLRFGLFSLFSGNYRIRSVIISDASVTLWRDDAGRNNYEIWKKEESGSDRQVDFDIQRVVLKRTGVYYRDGGGGTDLAVAFDYFTLRGKKTGTVYDLGLSGGFIAERLTFANTAYALPGRQALHAYLLIDPERESVIITDTRIQAGGEEFSLEGSLNYTRPVSNLDLTLAVKNSEIKNLLSLVPERYTASFKKYHPDGRLTAAVKISGKYGDHHFPLITADFSVKKGSAIYRDYNSEFSSISASGSYTHEAGNRPARLLLRSFSGSSGRGSFKGSLDLVDFRKPNIKLTLSSRLYLEEIGGFLANDHFKDATGQLAADIAYEGTFDAAQNISERASGTLDLRNAGFTLIRDGSRIREVNAALQLQNGSVLVDRLSFKTGRSDLSMSGSFSNLAAYLFMEGQPLFFDANVRSGRLSLEDLVPASADAAAEPGSAADHPVLPANVGFNVVFACDLFTYREFSAANVTGKLHMNDQVLRLEQFSMDAMDGRVSGSGTFNNRYGSYSQVVCNASLKNVDIHRLFREFGNFGQTSLQSHHLKGRADADVQYGAKMDNRLETDAASVSAVADLEIRNGELLGFEPLQELSRFLDENELKNVRFSTLKNRIEIARKTVIIPEMEVKSSVMGLKGYGSHTFGNEIDYHLNVLLSEIGKNKKRRNPAPPDATETLAEGKTRLFLHMSGTVDNPIVRYDSRAVVKKVTEDFKNQKQELRQVLREEFGKEPKTTDPKGKEKSNEVKFEIEWDDD